MKPLIEIINTDNEPNILSTMEWECKQITTNPMSQQITINEELLKGGFEMTRSYQHDEFVTCTFKRLNSNFYIELTYKESELVNTEIWCKDWEKVNPDTIPLLVQFLNANNL